MLDKIRKLMALALNNPSEEEARSAALKAVRMIAEHKVVLTLAGAKVVGASNANGPAPGFEYYYRPQKWWVDEESNFGRNDYEDIMRDLQDRMRQAEADAFWKPQVDWSADYKARPWK